MKKKKGFVFIETIMVTAVLTISLLMVYSAYSALIIKEKSRIKYNDSAYLYRTYYLEKFFKNFRLDMVASSLSKIGNIQVLASFGCTGDIFLNEEDNLNFCESILSELHVRHLYLTYNDLSFLQECTNTNGVCETLVQVNEQAASYLKTIGGKGKDGYRIIVEYAENKDGTQCFDENCEFRYATISVGELD